jgi:hypothetical protein
MRVDVVTAIMAEKDETRLLSDVLAGVPELARPGEIGNGRSRGSDATSTGRGSTYLAASIKRDVPGIP